MTLCKLWKMTFKLDNDFDFLIHDTYVEILHPSGFVFISDLDEQIIAGVNETVNQLSQAMPILNFTPIAEYITAKGARRAAKLLASIKSRNDLNLMNIQKLQSKCQLLGFHLVEDGNGKFITEEDRIIDLLEILDRRSYDYDLNTDNVVEIYIASSRRKKN